MGNKGIDFLTYGFKDRGPGEHPCAFCKYHAPYHLTLTERTTEGMVTLIDEDVCPDHVREKIAELAPAYVGYVDSVAQ